MPPESDEGTSSNNRGEFLENFCVELLSGGEIESSGKKLEHQEFEHRPPSIETIITRKSSANERCLSAAIGQATGGPTYKEREREKEWGEGGRESVSEVAYASDLWVWLLAVAAYVPRFCMGKSWSSTPPCHGLPSTPPWRNPDRV